MEARHVAKLLGSLRPYPQRNMLKALRGLMAFAVIEGLIHVDPTASYKPARIKDTGGFTPWTDVDIARFEATHPIGSRARLALALLLFTGQRRGDVVRMGRQHIHDGFYRSDRTRRGRRLIFRSCRNCGSCSMRPRATILRFLSTTPAAPLRRQALGNGSGRFATKLGSKA